MKTILSLLLLTCFVSPGFNQSLPDESSEEKTSRLEWWTNARYGMFIHFGLYSMQAEHAWYKTKENMTNEEYQVFFDHFNPDLFDAKAWAKIAKKAGMKYMVVTTKHHEGFCLWDTEYSDYKITNTPFGRDLIAELVDAFRAEGIPVGFYYSMIDWYHPEYTTDHKHPLRDDQEYVKLDKKRNMKIYQEYMQNQLRELLTEYGPVDHLFFDFSFVSQEGYSGKGKDDWNSMELLKIVRDLQPKCIINDRIDLLDVEGGWDFRTPEEFMPDEWVRYKGEKVPWETCQTLSGKWSYATEENANWRSPSQVIALLIEVVSKGGNLLLNAGPNARGEIDSKSTDLLLQTGEWLRLHGRSIYGCKEAPEGIKAPNGTILTYNEKTGRLYLHLLNWPFKKLKVDGLGGKVEYAQFLHDASHIKEGGKVKGPWMDDVQISHDFYIFELPVQKPAVEIPVIEIFLKQ